MENKNWEDFFNDLTGDLQREENKTSPGESSLESGLSDSTGTPEDALLKEKLSDYSPSAPVEGWDKIVATLDAADEAFDHQVRNRIHQYHSTYDPQSWSKFAKRFSAHKHLRTRLIVLKLSEAAAILLLLMTALHLGQKGQLPFQEQLTEKNAGYPDHSLASTSRENQTLPADQTVKEFPLTSKYDPDRSTLRIASSKSNTPLSGKEIIKNTITDASPEIDCPGVSVTNLSSPATPFITEIEMDSDLAPEIETSAEVLDPENSNPAERANATMVDFLSPPVATVEYKKQNPIQIPTLVANANKTYLEFGILAQADYNQLKMPEDRLSSNGEQIIFPLQGITSPGFGAGFTLALGHPRWALESGVIYNAKSFRPGRELTIGDEADNSNVEYEAMHMQMVSVPLQFRYRVDAKGRLKTYAFAGFGLNVIAQSDIDVKVDYNFPSLPEGEDPNNNPSLARTIRQTQRVSEDIRDRAPFSTNSYISANVGLGVEYSLVESKTLFLQTAYQYQVPNLRFSNHNGKHVLSLSLQAGVRTPLGI